MDAYGVEATSETQKWRRRDPEIDPKEKEQCMNGKGDRLMKGPLVTLPVFRQFVCCDLSACMLLFFMLLVVMMMSSRFCMLFLC